VEYFANISVADCLYVAASMIREPTAELVDTLRLLGEATAYCSALGEGIPTVLMRLVHQRPTLTEPQKTVHLLVERAAVSARAKVTKGAEREEGCARSSAPRYRSLRPNRATSWPRSFAPARRKVPSSGSVQKRGLVFARFAQPRRHNTSGSLRFVARGGRADRHRNAALADARPHLDWRRSGETAAFRSSEFPGDRESSSRDRCGRTMIGTPLICPIASTLGARALRRRRRRRSTACRGEVRAVRHRQVRLPVTAKIWRGCKRVPRPDSAATLDCMSRMAQDSRRAGNCASCRRGRDRGGPWRMRRHLGLEPIFVRGVHRRLLRRCACARRG
jgi:hypothetical protein